MFDELKARFKKVGYSAMGKQKESEMQELWMKWNQRFNTAYASYDVSSFDDNEAVYLGTFETKRNVNSRKTGDVKKTNNVPNVTFELIESEINTATPTPKVTSVRPGFDDYATMIADKIISDVKTMKIEQVTDIGERNTYIHGISHILVDWDMSKGSHEWLGDKEFKSYHPKNVIPQPNVYDVDDMDYFFIVSSETIDSVKRKTGIDLEGESEQYPEINTIDANASQETKSGTQTSEKVSVVTCYYFDEDGDIGMFSWVNNVPLQHYEKYFYPRVEVCQSCGTENEQDAEQCHECGSTKLETSVIMFEEIEEDLELEPLIFPKKKKIVRYKDPETQESPYVEVNVSQEVVERFVPAGTRIPIPVPKKYPLRSRLNIPLNFSFAGRSDVATIRPQQETMKKTLSRIEEKVLNSSGIIAIPEKMKRQVSNDVYQVWTGSPADISQIYTKETGVQVQQDMEYFNLNKDVAKSTLGITDSFQGKYDPSAKSGKAKEVQIEQAAGRLQSKIKNKFTFYGELFHMMFMMDMCFMLEPRPYTRLNAKGENEYEEFDKHQLLLQDKEGEWFYNTDFIVKAEISSDLSHDKVYMIDKAFEMFQIQAIDDRKLLQLLSGLNFPLANRLLEQVDEEEDQKNDIALIVGMMKAMDPQQMMQFIQLPIEEQMQMINEAQAEIS